MRYLHTISWAEAKLQELNSSFAESCSSPLEGQQPLGALSCSLPGSTLIPPLPLSPSVCVPVNDQAWLWWGAVYDKGRENITGKGGFDSFFLARRRKKCTRSHHVSTGKPVSQIIYLIPPNLNILWAEEAQCSNLLPYSMRAYQKQ